MNTKDNHLPVISEDDITLMITDTSKLIAQRNVDNFSASLAAAHNSNALTNEVEFMKWMNQNFEFSGIFESTASMQKYIASGKPTKTGLNGHEEWIKKQLQGKGYEWDWMKTQRDNVKNLFKQYDAGTVSNQPSIDVVQKNLLNGDVQEFQMKAYTGKTNPNLSNTSKDTTIVTNVEKADIVRGNGYTDVEAFQDADIIKNATEQRLDRIKSGKAQTTYNFKNVSATMAKAGAIGCVVGMGTEAIVSYKAWKNGSLSDDEYLMEIMKSGGDAGITSGATAGIMVPVSAMITTAGLSSLVTIPVAFVVAGAVNKVVAPCFGRGQYREILNEAKYYQSIEDIYDDFTIALENTMNQYSNYINQMVLQEKRYNQTKEVSAEVDKKLADIYNKI